jgi:hypothetical protein
MTDDLSVFALFALEHAADSVVPHGGPLIPFAMTRTAEGAVNLQRFVGELTAGQEQARAAVRASGGTSAQAAVAWDGYLTSEGKRVDAVFVEASRGGEASVVVAQPYHRVGLLRKRWETFGEPVVLPRGEPLY